MDIPLQAYCLLAFFFAWVFAVMAILLARAQAIATPARRVESKPKVFERKKLR